MPTLWDAGRPTIPGTYKHKRVPGRDGAMPPAGHGSALSACFAPAIYGAWGCAGGGRGVLVPWPPR